MATSLTNNEIETYFGKNSSPFSLQNLIMKINNLLFNSQSVESNKKRS